jgi:phospholipid/cholesterol/gamma-HCH transport system substrate-binding protein
MSKSALAVRGPLIKSGVFAVVTGLILVFLGLQLGRVEFGPQRSYRAVFTSASGLTSGDLVMVAGVRVGQVQSVSLTPGDQALVTFTVQSSQPVLVGSDADIRWQDLVGDQYLEITEGHGSTAGLPAGGTIPVTQTAPALDLDTLLNGFQPLFAGLQPNQVNQLSGELISVLQGEGGSVDSLLATTASLTNSLADHGQLIGQLITNLNTLLGNVDQHDQQLSQTVVQLQQLVSGLAAQRNSLGNSLVQINQLSATVGSLLTDARSPVKESIAQVNRVAATLDQGRNVVNYVLGQLPGDYYAMERAGSHGSYFNFYLCGLRLKLTGPNGKPFYTPFIGPNANTARCGNGS